MLKKLAAKIFSQGPSDVLTMILGPTFIIYGAGIMVGYRESLVSILGLPAWVYAVVFIVAGMLKLAGLIFDWGRFSHTIGVTLSTFWASVILILAPSTAGWVGATPWVAIAFITFAAAVWPDPPIAAVIVTPQLLDSDTDPAMRALDYINRHAERNGSDDPDGS